jgi:hypothetical protein
MRKGGSIATLSMLTPKHTIWDEIPNALQTYEKNKISKYFCSKNFTSGCNFIVFTIEIVVLLSIYFNLPSVPIWEFSAFFFSV